MDLTIQFFKEFLESLTVGEKEKIVSGLNPIVSQFEYRMFDASVKEELKFRINRFLVDNGFKENVFELVYA